MSLASSGEHKNVLSFSGATYIESEETLFGGAKIKNRRYCLLMEYFSHTLSEEI